MVEIQQAAGTLLSPSGDCFTSAFFLLAACLQPGKNASREKIPERNKGVTEKPCLSPGSVPACDDVGAEYRVRFHTPSEGWTGKEFEDETGLYSFGYRHYDPELSIWTTPDPAAEFFNPYSYLGGDPINLIDPLGLTGNSPNSPIPGTTYDGFGGFYIPGDPGLNLLGGQRGSSGTSAGSGMFGIGGGGFVSVHTTPMFTFTVQTGAEPTVFNTPEQPGMSGLDVLKLAVGKVQEASDLGAQLNKAEKGGFKDESGKVDKKKVAQAAAIILVTSVVTGKGKAPRGAVGFAPGTAKTAIEGMRGGGGHAIRHLEGTIIPKTGSLQSRVDAFTAVATPILESPSHAANWRIGATNGRAFLGTVNGKNVVIVVASEGPQQGKVISSFIPDANQLNLLLSR